MNEPDAGTPAWHPDTPEHLLSRNPWYAVVVTDHHGTGGRGTGGRGTGRAVVVVLEPGAAPGPVEQERLRRDSRAAAGLHHPNVLRLRADPDPDRTVRRLVAPLPDGAVDLVPLVPGEAPPGAVLPVLAQVADALDRAHRAGLVHGDVRPESVVVDPRSGRAYLLGFGLGPRPGLTRHPAPEVPDGAWSGAPGDVYAFGALLAQCVPGPAPDPGPARRPPSCRAVVDAAAAAYGTTLPPPAPRPRRRRWVLAAAVAAVLVVVAALLVVPRVRAALYPSAADLDRVPVAVRDTCALGGADVLPAGSARRLRCHDAAGQEVAAALYDSGPAAEAGYRAAVSALPGVRTGSGDCADSPGWEHGYPGVGPETGRVACVDTGGTARMVWLDRAARAVLVASRTDGDTLALYRSWAGWVAIPAFPTPAESVLTGQLYETSCRRSPAGALDGIQGVGTAVDCTPTGTGATSVRYLHFTDDGHLRRAYSAAAAAGHARSGISCLDTSQPTADGDATYDLHSTVEGRLTCTTDGDTTTITWSADALLDLAVATGPDRKALIDWWYGYAGPRNDQLITALNQQAQPPFPTGAESDLLTHVPTASRSLCSRLSPEQIQNSVGTAASASVGCTPQSGPGVALYFQLTSAEALAAAVGSGGGPDCTTNPSGFSGRARYTRADGTTGVLTCGVNSAGRYVLEWGEERSEILGFAFDSDPARLLAWWQTSAGPS